MTGRLGVGGLLLLACVLPAPAFAQKPDDAREEAQTQLVQGLAAALSRDPFAVDPFNMLRDLARTPKRLRGVADQLAAQAAGSQRPFADRLVAARLYDLCGDRARANEQLRLATQTPPTDARTLTRLASYAEVLGNHDVAAFSYESLAQLATTANKPEDAAAATLKAAEHLLARNTKPDVKRAMELWRSAGASAPIDVRLRFADSLVQRGLRREAAIEFEAIATQAGRSAKGPEGARYGTLAYRRLAESRAALGDRRGAATAMLRAMKLGTVRARAELAPQVVLAYKRAGTLADLIRRAPVELGDSPATQAFVGDAQIAAGDRQRGLAAYRAAALKAPNDVFIRLRLAAIATDPAEVISQREKVVALQPDEPSFHLDLARALFAAKRKEEAERVLHSASRRFTAAPAVQFEIAAILRTQKRCEPALDPLQRAVALDPDDDAFVAALADCRYQLGKKGEASAALWRYAEAKKSVARYRRVVDFYARRKDTAEQERAYAAWLRLTPADTQARRAYAVVLTDRGKLAEALEAWKRVQAETTDRFAKQQSDYAIRRLERAIQLKSN